MKLNICLDKTCCEIFSWLLGFTTLELKVNGWNESKNDTTQPTVEFYCFKSIILIILVKHHSYLIVCKINKKRYKSCIVFIWFSIEVSTLRMGFQSFPLFCTGLVICLTPQGCSWKTKTRTAIKAMLSQMGIYKWFYIYLFKYINISYINLHVTNTLNYPNTQMLLGYIYLCPS